MSDNRNKIRHFLGKALLGDYYTTYEPLEQEVGDFIRENVSNPKNYSNDLRHQYASAVFAQKYGPEKAKFFGDMNEFLDFGQSGVEDTEIDKKNNGIGINYGLQYPNYDKQQLLKLMLENLQKERGF